jgi:hypothetical protein
MCQDDFRASRSSVVKMGRRGTAVAGKAVERGCLAVAAVNVAVVVVGVVVVDVGSRNLPVLAATTRTRRWAYMKEQQTRQN